MFMIKDDIAYTIEDKSSESGGYPATEIKDWEFQFDLWRATGTSDEWIMLDLGDPKAVNGIGILNPNVPQVIIEGNATTTFTSPSFATGTVTMEKDPFRERYYHYFDATALSGFNYRYLRIFFPSGQSAIDGDTVYSLGGVVVSDSAEELPFTTNRGITMTPLMAGENVNFLSGRNQFVQRGERRMSWQVNFNLARDETEAEQAIRNFFAIDQFTPVLMNINSEYHEQSGKKNLTYPFKREEGINYSVAQFGMAVTEGLVLNETV